MPFLVLVARKETGKKVSTLNLRRKQLQSAVAVKGRVPVSCAAIDFGHHPESLTLFYHMANSPMHQLVE